jgi:hypothetical protein
MVRIFVKKIDKLIYCNNKLIKWTENGCDKLVYKSIDKSISDIDVSCNILTTLLPKIGLKLIFMNLVILMYYFKKNILDILK